MKHNGITPKIQSILIKTLLLHTLPETLVFKGLETDYYIANLGIHINNC